MTAGTVTISGTKYAAGLYWQPSPDKNVAAAARKVAKQPGFQAEFFCVRQPSKIQPVGQFGLGVSAAGHKGGMPSIAACLANQQRGSWAGAFRVTEGIYFISVRDDLIDPDGDAWYAHDDDAHTRMEQEVARGGLSHVYCPSEWGVQNSETISLTSILAGRKDITLQSVGVPKSLIFTIFFLLVVGGIVYGAYSFWNKIEQDRLAKEAAELAALQAQQRALAPAVEYPKTWQDSPLPMDYLRACEQAMAKLRARYLGWKGSGTTCSGTSLSISWTRSGGGYAEIPGNGKLPLDPALSSASMSIPLEGLQPRGPEALAYYGLIDEATLYHNWPVTYTLLPDDVIVTPEGQPPPPPPAWRKRSVTYAVKGAPWERPDLFGSIPGLVITSVKENDGTNFTVEGTIYENKQP